MAESIQVLKPNNLTSLPTCTPTSSSYFDMIGNQCWCRVYMQYMWFQLTRPTAQALWVATLIIPPIHRHSLGTHSSSSLMSPSTQSWYLLSSVSIDPLVLHSLSTLPIPSTSIHQADECKLSWSRHSLFIEWHVHRVSSEVYIHFLQLHTCSFPTSTISDRVKTYGRQPWILLSLQVYIYKLSLFLYMPLVELDGRKRWKRRIE